MKSNNFIIKITLLSVFFIILDQALKYIYNTYYSNLISKNTGLLFGIIENSIVKYLLLFFGLAFLVYLILQTDFSKRLNVVAIALILGGALSNFIDRIIYKHVVDFISLPSFLSFWPTFNLADVFIVLGVFIYIYQMINDK